MVLIPMLRLNSSEIADASASSHEMYGWFTSAKANLPYRLWPYASYNYISCYNLAKTHETVSLSKRVPLGMIKNIISSKFINICREVEK